MNGDAKRVEELQIADFMAYPVWHYINRDELGETSVQPVKEIPVANLIGKIIGTQIRLANGDTLWALIGNVNADNSRVTEHFLTLSIERGRKWFALARYFDFNCTTHGPEALANFLALNVNQVFPISYDITRFARGDQSALSGQILKEPRERLTHAELIEMAVQ